MSALLSGWIMIFGMASPATPVEDCAAVSSQLKLPAVVKARGKPKRVRWEHVNRMMPLLRESVQGACDLTFEQVFAPKREDVFFPLLDSVIRTVPEESLIGVPVYYLDGFKAGTYSNRVVFEKSSYKQYYFQFKLEGGRLETSNRNLLDYATGKPVFIVRWEDVRKRVLITGSERRPATMNGQGR